MDRRIIVLIASLLLALTVVAQAGTEVAETTPIDERESLQCPRFVMPSRLAVQRAIQLAESGESYAAALQLEAAVEYDPLSPHVRLAQARYAAGSPGATLMTVATAIETMAKGFPNQLVLSLNFFLIAVWIVTLGFVGTAGAIVFRYARHVHHSLYEVLRTRLGRHASIVAALVILIPLLWGIGLIATLIFFLLWFNTLLRPRERSIVYALIVIGGFLWVVHFVAPGPLAPPSQNHAPYRVATSFQAGGTPGYVDDLEVGAPSGYAEWARGMIAWRQGRLADAERELDAAVALLPDHYGVRTDLGNVQFKRGRIEKAKKSYQQAIGLAPEAAAPHYNLAQIFNEELDLLGADREIRAALSLDQPLVAAFTETSVSTRPRATMDVLPDEAPFWSATLRGDGVDGRLPLPTGLQILSPGGQIHLLPIGVLIMAGLGVLAGQWLTRTVKTYACGSCGKIVCRRCLVRVDGIAYCRDCGQTLSADCSAEYSRALLQRYFQKDVTVRSVSAGLIRWLLPGWAESSDWPVARSVFVLSLCGAALLVISLPGFPVTGYPADPAPIGLDGAPWVLGALLYMLARVMTWRWTKRVDPESGSRRRSQPSERKVVGA